jgi:hypothetical protein
MSNQLKVFIPLIIYGRDSHEYESISCGCFVKYEDAVNSLVDELIKTNFISFGCFVDSYEDNKEEESEDEEKEDVIDIENFTKKDFTEMIKKKINGDYSSLEKVCNQYGDSYFEDGWKIRIDEHVLCN